MIAAQDIERAYDELGADLDEAEQHALAQVVDLAEGLGKGGNPADGLRRIILSLRQLTEAIALNTKDLEARHLAGAFVAATSVMEAIQ